MATATTEEIEYDFSQLDDTLISDHQKQSLIDYINQLKSQKRSATDDFNAFKLSTGPVKRRRTKRPPLSNSISLPTVNHGSAGGNFQTMLETLIYIVQEINLEQVKLTTTINQLSQRVHQNESYLNQLNTNIETLYEQFHVKQYSELELDPIVLPESSSSFTDDHCQQPLDMSITGQHYHAPIEKVTGKSTGNKEYVELGDPSVGLSCLVLKRKYDQVRRRTELAYIHGEKRAIGRLLTFLIRQFFSNNELRNASLDGRVRNTQALGEDRMGIIDKHLQSIFGIDYNLYRITKDCAEQVNVVCRHARNPKHAFESAGHGASSQDSVDMKMSTEDDNERQLDEYEFFQEQLFIQANEQRFHELASEYDSVHSEVVKQRDIESQFRAENDDLKRRTTELEEQLTTVRHNEQQLNAKLQTVMEQVRQLSAERDQLKNVINEKEKENYELHKKCETFEEENRQVHNINTSTITRLQELESTSSQLQSLESLWTQERQLYTEQLQALEQSLIETKKVSIDQQTQLMQLTVQLESTDGPLRAQQRSLEVGIDEKNEAILNLDRQLRERTQRIEQLQADLQRTVRQTENQQIAANKTIQSLKTQNEELLKKNTALNESYDEQNQLLSKISAGHVEIVDERDVIRTEMSSLAETVEKQSTENEQTIRRLQDELDNTTQLLESIRSKGADLTQLTNFLDGTLNHIRSNDSTSTAPVSSNTTCSECRQLKSALVLELTGKERFRFGYEQLSSMIKEAAPILRRQKQDYEASFEVIGKLTSELNEARKELTELHHMSGESIENYRYIQRENQFLINDNKSLATKIQVLLSEIEELRTGKRPSERAVTPEPDPNQQVPLTFRNVVELQHVNQKLDKMVREMRAQSNHDDEDLNRTRFDELKKEHQQQQEKLKESRSQIDALETQMASLVQERDFLRLLVSRSSSSQSAASTVASSVDVHQLENLRDQLNRSQEKLEQANKKMTELTNEKDDLKRVSNEKIRSINYELLTARTEIEQTNEKVTLIGEEQATNRLTIASLRTEINGWQERHATLVQIRNKQEQQYFHVLTEMRQIRDEKAALECRLSALENERRFDSIKHEQIASECMLLKSEIVKNEQIHPVIEKLQGLAESTKEKMKAMFEAKLNDLTVENDQLRQRIEQHERDRELTDRTYQSRSDELAQNLQQEKTNHAEIRAKYQLEKERADQFQRQLNEIETKLNSNTHQKTDFEQQLGDYEKELKMLRVKLDAANNELELKQTLVQSSVDNANQLNVNGQKAAAELENVKQESTAKSVQYESEIDRLKQEILTHQASGNQNEEAIRALNERMQAMQDQHQVELTGANERHDQLMIEKNLVLAQLQSLELSLGENEQLKEKLIELESTIQQQQANLDEIEKRNDQLSQEISSLQSEHERLLGEIQQDQATIAQRDDTIRVQGEMSQQLEERYAQLEEKHKEQHATMMKLSTHLAAKESEAMAPATADAAVNETWNAILGMNNYLRVENARLSDDVERIRLENAHIHERNQSLEQTHANDEQIIEDFRVKNQSLGALQERFDSNQQQISDFEQRCQSYEQEKQSSQQAQKQFQTSIEELNQQKQLLSNQLKQSEETRGSNEKQIADKATAIEQQTQEIENLKARVAKLEAENQDLRQMITKLKAIANKYKATATATAVTPAVPSPSTTASPATASAEPAEALLTGAVEAATTIEPDANKNRSLPADLTEKMNKMRDTLVQARTLLTAQQSRANQLTSELARVKQSRISTDLTEVHAMVDSIRQIYEVEINELKKILQLFDSANSNESIAEILRLRKKIDELSANKPSASTPTPSSTAKQSEDVTPKPARPQMFASSMTQESNVSRVAPMAPLTGRQIGVAIPMTASTTPTTTSTPLWTATTTTEAASAQPAAPIDHPAASSQLTTPAAVNLLMKRTRPDDGDHKTTESTLKRTKAETETNPLIAHVEPQVREQQQQQVTVQEQLDTIETSIIDSTRTDVQSTPNESDILITTIDDSMPVDPPGEIELRSNALNTGSAIVVTAADTIQAGTAASTDANNAAANESNNEQRRNDIVPIVYDVQSIQTIGSGGSAQLSRGGPGRVRPSMSISATRRTWLGRGGNGGIGRGGLGGRGASGGPPARQ